MHMTICRTLDEIKKAAPPYKALRNNENKQWRESWVAAKFCESLGWTDALICVPAKDDGDDVFVKHDNKSHPFQIAEMAPRDRLVMKNLPSSKEDENGLISCEVHGSLGPQITYLVQTLVQKKDEKFYANQEDMNLLIYLNPSGALFIDAEEDIDIAALKEQMQTFKFKTISLYADERVTFIKGDVSSLDVVK